MALLLETQDNLAERTVIGHQKACEKISAKEDDESLTCQVDANRTGQIDAWDGCPRKQEPGRVSRARLLAASGTALNRVDWREAQLRGGSPINRCEGCASIEERAPDDRSWRRLWWLLFLKVCRERRVDMNLDRKMAAHDHQSARARLPLLIERELIMDGHATAQT